LIVRIYRLPLEASIAVALLFVVAPHSGESVDWISGRTTVLSFFFMLLSIWCWTLSMRECRAPWIAVIWMVFATMTYEAAVIVPVVLACLVPAR
jgi:predicted ABC-type exoprotein transport system permease subunit